MSILGEVTGQIAGSDQALADRWPESDPHFEDLFRSHRPLLVRYAERRNSLDPEGVADLALFDGYLVLDEMRDKSDRAFWSHLYKAVNSHIAREHSKQLPVPVDLSEQEETLTTTFEANLIESIDLSELLTELSPDQQAVVQHRFQDGLTAEQTAKRLGKSPNAVRQLQFRAIRRLRSLLLVTTVAMVLIAGYVVLTRSDAVTVIDNSPATRNGEGLDDPGLPPVPLDSNDERSTGLLDSQAEFTSVDSAPSGEQVDQPTITVAATTTTVAPIDDPPEPSTSFPEPTTTTVIPEPTTTLETVPPPRLAAGAILFRAAHSDMCVEVPDSSFGTNLTVVQASCDGGLNQQFRPVDAGDGYVQLVAVHSNLCLHVRFAVADSGAEVIQDDCTGSNNSLWSLDVQAEGGRVKVQHTEMCLDVASARTDSGAPLVQARCHTGPNQYFSWA